ncbi:MAG: hypothetical protein GOU98_03420 [Candidatus Altiarchaeota archaeon]|nr:hypothetical protein [Candidatus Altiarchaeota archaeon]
MNEKMNPGYIKLELLANGVSLDSEAVDGFKGSYIEKKYRFGRSDDTHSPEIVPYELELPQDVVAGIHHNSNSPWRVGLRGGELELTLNGKHVCDVNFVPRPKFWGHKLSSGVFADDVAVLYTKYALTFFANGYCRYWDEGVPCWFCSLHPTRSHDASVVSEVTPSVARELVELALKTDSDRINCIKFTSGTPKDRDKGFLEAVNIWKTISPVSRATGKDILHHLVALPPENLELFNELKKADVNTISMALEVTDPELFKKLCPGKAKYIGYDGYMEAFEKAVEVFGFGNVYCALVGGIEPLEPMYKVLNELASKGVVPSVNLFHPDQKSKMASHPRPDSDFLRKMVIEETKIFDKWDFEPCVKGNTRNALDNECVRGFFRK